MLQAGKIFNRINIETNVLCIGIGMLDNEFDGIVYMKYPEHT